MRSITFLIYDFVEHPSILDAQSSHYGAESQQQ